MAGRRADRRHPRSQELEAVALSLGTHPHLQWHLSQAEFVNHNLVDVIDINAPF